MCKACAKAAWKRYYERNVEDMRERSRQYHTNNPEKEQARRKRYRQENPEKVKTSARNWRQNNPEKAREGGRRYRLRNPEKARDRLRRSRAKHGRKPEDPEKMRARNVRYRLLYPEKVRAMERRAREEHPETGRAARRRYRAKKRGAPGEYRHTDLKVLYELQRGLCCWCGKPIANKFTERHLSRYERFTDDHIIALSRGGTDYAHNIVLVCWRCNWSRQQKHVFSEWQPPNMLEWMRDYVMSALEKRID